VVKWSFPELRKILLNVKGVLQEKVYKV